MLAEATIKVAVTAEAEQQEILIALLADVGAHAFEEKRDAVYAYFMESAYNAEAVEGVIKGYSPGLDVTVTVIPAQDWNAEWEKNFESVLVDDFVEVHPPFRAATPGIQHHLVLTPRMAFGTGHHATTWLMLQYCSKVDFQGKQVLDMGCGTAVLGIMASMLGAAFVTAIDIDPWSYENGLENAVTNGVENIEVLIGDAGVVPDRCYEIVFANINRNVLIADRDVYVRHLTAGGDLLLSGIMDQDEEMITRHYEEAGLRLVARNSRKEWVMLAFKKEEGE